MGYLASALLILGQAVQQSQLAPNHQYTGETEKAMLANRDIDLLKTAKVELQVDGITKSMVVFVIAEDAPYILLGRDHPSVRSWICRKPTARPQADPLHTPLAAITRVQSQVLAEGEIANAFANQRDGAEAKPIELPKLKRKESERPKPGPVVADTQLPDLEVELADLPEEASPSTSPPGEKVTRAEDSASGEGEEGDDSAVEEEGRLSGELEGEYCNDHPLPTLGKGKEEVNMLIAQQKADDSLLEVRKNAES